MLFIGEPLGGVVYLLTNFYPPLIWLHSAQTVKTFVSRPFAMLTQDAESAEKDEKQKNISGVKPLDAFKAFLCGLCGSA